MFQRAQHELRLRPNSISAYVDIKTVYEAADVDPTTPAQLAAAGVALSEASLRRVLLYRAFIKAVFEDIKGELKKQISTSFFAKILDKAGQKRSEVIASINELLEGSFEAQLTDVTALKTIATKISNEVSFSAFCEGDADAVYRHLFYASMANPRILGHILTNLRDAVTAYQQMIGVRSVQEAAAKYFTDKIEPFFGVQKFSHASFSERASVFNLKELLESIVSRARDLRDYKDSKVTRDISGRTPSSHFHIAKSLESSLRTLELNFFLTLYYEMKDRDGKPVSVYAINYGLCQQQSITFGRPSGQREHRLYFVERIFDYTGIVRRFLASNQEIKCNGCSAVHGLEKLEGLLMYDMMCPKCKTGTCEITNLSKKYEEMLRSVDPNLLLPPTDIGMLETIFTEGKTMVASEIAGELDCSYQMIGKRGKILEDLGLVARDRNEEGRRIFDITPDARRDYFEGNDARTLSIEDVPK